MLARPGDWLIQGVAGEIYPCKPDIFATIYEPAIADRNPEGGDVQHAPSRSDESGGAGTAIAQPQTPISGTS